MISKDVCAYVLSTCMCKYSLGEVRTVTSIIRRLKFTVPRLPRALPSDSKEKYTTVWTSRGIMLLRMEQVGMKPLPLGGITLDKFASMKPDQKGNLEKLIAGYCGPSRPGSRRIYRGPAVPVNGSRCRHHRWKSIHTAMGVESKTSSPRLSQFYGLQ